MSEVNCEVFLYSFTFKSVEDLESLQGVKRRTREASSSIAPSRKTGGGKDASHPREFSRGGERTMMVYQHFFPDFRLKFGHLLYRIPVLGTVSGWCGRVVSVFKEESPR